jgi:hypothetical protein
MSTAAQQQANQQNAKHSTGPRTAEGKKRSSQNALKHGFFSTDPLIRGEDPDKFLQHGAELYHSLAPMTPLQEDLVEQIIDITWRLKRFQRIESSILNELYDGAAEQPSNHDKEPDDVYGKALAPQGCLDSLSRISRYESTLRRAYHSCLKELRTLRKASRQGDFLHGFGLLGKPKPKAEPQQEPNSNAEQAANTASESEMLDLTQSVATLLESIAPMKSANREPGGRQVTNNTTNHPTSKIHPPNLRPNPPPGHTTTDPNSERK